jgi:GTP cyclohydrolase I
MDSKRVAAAVRELLAAIGENPDREALSATPEKVAQAYAEFFRGVGQDPLAPLSEGMTSDQRDPVILRDIELVSICEHHLLPFTGVAHIAYLPSGKIVGLGRLAQVVEVLAARPQLQENLTNQIADALETALAPRGVFVMLEARHQCVASRGARQPEVNTMTLAARGELAEPAARSEIIALLAVKP